MSVYVLDRSGQPLMPCSEKRARLLLARGRARVHRQMPFAIRLVDRKVESSVLQPVRIKLDPGSKATGLAVVRIAEHVSTQTGYSDETADHWLEHTAGAAFRSSVGKKIQVANTKNLTVQERRLFGDVCCVFD